MKKTSITIKWILGIVGSILSGIIVWYITVVVLSENVTSRKRFIDQKKNNYQLNIRRDSKLNYLEMISYGQTNIDTGRLVEEMSEIQATVVKSRFDIKKVAERLNGEYGFSKYYGKLSRTIPRRGWGQEAPDLYGLLQ